MKGIRLEPAPEEIDVEVSALAGRGEILNHRVLEKGQLKPCVEAQPILAVADYNLSAELPVLCLKAEAPVADERDLRRRGASALGGVKRPVELANDVHAQQTGARGAQELDEFRHADNGLTRLAGHNGLQRKGALRERQARRHAVTDGRASIEQPALVVNLDEQVSALEMEGVSSHIRRCILPTRPKPHKRHLVSEV